MARKKKEIENVKEIPEYIYIYHKGDSIIKIAEEMTGHSYLWRSVLLYSGYGLNNIPDNALLKWRL